MPGHRSVLAPGLLLLLSVSTWAINFSVLEGDPGLQEGNVRLGGSAKRSEGRLEVYHDGKWGTVCDDNWDMHDTEVVCRELKFPGAKSIVAGSNYGTGAPYFHYISTRVSGPIWLDDVHCNGTESHLAHCDFKGWGESDCTHKEDVGIICETRGANAYEDSLHSFDHTIGLSEDLGRIFDTGEGCDIHILVKAPVQNQKNASEERILTEVCAHKMIVSQLTSFRSTQENANITVVISKPCEPYFNNFIRYIYTRKIDVNLSSALCLHWMAANFGAKQLMKDIGRLFSKILLEDTSFRTQVSLYSYALETSDFTLEEASLQFLAWNFQNLTKSPAWASLSVKLLESLLIRSDLVVPNEYFVLQNVERFIMERDSSLTFETQAKLLRYVRFPMIDVEKLYENGSSSPLYHSHKDLYNEAILQAFEFNVLYFTTLLKNPKFDKENANFHVRIYTSEPWSTIIDVQSLTQGRNLYHYQNPHYNQYSPMKSFRTPAHHTKVLKDNGVNWHADVFVTKTQCSQRGFRCDAVPAFRLASQHYGSQTRNILYRNRLVVMCNGLHVCQVYGFKSDLISVATNGTDAECHCPTGSYTYQFVVRPQYVQLT